MSLLVSTLSRFFSKTDLISTYASSGKVNILKSSLPRPWQGSAGRSPSQKSPGAFSESLSFLRPSKMFGSSTGEPDSVWLVATLGPIHPGFLPLFPLESNTVQLCQIRPMPAETLEPKSNLPGIKPLLAHQSYTNDDKHFIPNGDTAHVGVIMRGSSQPEIQG